MMQAVQHAGTWRCRWGACDDACGRAPTRLDHLAGLGWWSSAEGPPDTQVWRERPATTGPTGSGRGRKPTRARLAAALPANLWSRPPLTDGRQGPIGADFVAGRVVTVRDGRPGPEEGWSRRRHGLTGDLTPSRSHAAADTRLPTLVRLSGRRWPIDTCVEEGTPHRGMGDDEVCAWRGWHHHLTVCLLAHFCLVRRQCRITQPPRP